jgi:KTSC domain
MHRHAVNSSVLQTIGYDERNNVLEVEFHTGRVYQYLAVPRAIYKDLLDAPSLGEFFNRQIRNEYEFLEVTKR